MFEGKPPIPARAGDYADTGSAQVQLRALSWSELIARFTAARELQSALISPSDQSLASFDAQSARHLAAMHEGECEIGKEVVNLDDSGNRKGAKADTVAVTDSTDRSPEVTHD